MAISYIASDYIDMPTINSACMKIKDYATDYVTLGTAVKQVSEEFGNDNLKIDNQTMVETISETGDGIQQIQKYISDYADQILFQTKEAYDALQKELDRIKAEDEAKAAAAAAAASSSN